MVFYQLPSLNILLWSYGSGIWCMRNFAVLPAVKRLAARALAPRLARLVGWTRWLNVAGGIGVAAVGTASVLGGGGWLGAFEVPEWVEMSAVIFSMSAVAAVCAAVLGNCVIGIWLAIAIGRALRLRRAESGPFFERVTAVSVPIQFPPSEAIPG